jgi:hypothetical protein
MTMLYVVVAASAIYAAADAKRFPAEDTTQKIFIVGKDAAVMNGGFAFIPGVGPNGTGWDACEEFSKIAGSIPDGEFDEQFAYLRRRIFASFSQALSSYRGQLPSDKNLAFFFVKYQRGKAYVARQEIAFNTDASGQHNATTSSPTLIANGSQGAQGIWWDVPAECVIPTAELSYEISWQSLVTLFHHVAEQSQMCSREIGDPIRAVILNDSGARWMQDDKQ